MLVGSGMPLWLGAGIRSYGSMWGPKRACRERRPLSGSVDGFPRRERVGKARVECFASKKGRVNGTLLMHWEPGYESAWVILTDLEPEEARVSWYGLRTWIEGGFKDFKRGLWGWHHSKMERASSVERLWLAMALAQLWCVSLGCQAEAEFEAAGLQHEPGTALPERHIARQRRTRAGGQLPVRRLGCV